MLNIFGFLFDILKKTRIYEVKYNYKYYHFNILTLNKLYIKRKESDTFHSF